ncbi:MAG: hypothetical protein ACRBHB_22160 [Arenicella sp.]
MNKATNDKVNVNNRHLKAILIGGGVCAVIGAYLGFMAGFTKEGAGAGFLLGWVVGEIVGLAVSETNN